LSLPIEPLYDEKTIYKIIEKLSKMWEVLINENFSSSRSKTTVYKACSFI
jgi:hypothetical protein